MFDHVVELCAPDLECPLDDWEIRHMIAKWCDENATGFAISRKTLIWFADEIDATVFFMRFA